MTFSSFPLHPHLQRAIASAGFDTPTPIQAAAIPLALSGRDLLGTAQTGTGKTAAFALPILHQLLHEPPARGRRMRALVLTPTRELADQVQAAIQQFAEHTHMRSATVYGGVGMLAQEKALRDGTEIIVACPGRLLDHAARGVNFGGVNYLVLDEADRMLDMGFLPAIKRIIALLPAERQTMLFSATFAPELQGFVKQTLRNPECISMGIAAPPETVAHTLYPVPNALKTTLLTALLPTISSNSVLIFTRTKHRADRVAAQLTRAGYQTGVLHSNRSQPQRQRALAEFRAGTVPYLVATDIAARGIDVEMISHVINFDIPDTVDAYIHRIGRTGRALRTGEAFTLVTSEDRDTILAIERALGEKLPTQFLAGFNYQQAGAVVEERPPLRNGNRQRSTPRAKLPAAKPLASTANHRQPTTPTGVRRPAGGPTGITAPGRNYGRVKRKG